MKKLLIPSLSAMALIMGGCSPHSIIDPVQTSSVTHTDNREVVRYDAEPNVRSTTVIISSSPVSDSEYRSSIAGPGLLGLVSSQLAQTKATHPSVKAFADAEVAEQVQISNALKQMNTTIPLLNAKQQVIMTKLKAAPKGQQFDEVYLEAQIDNHERLKTITKNYLSNTNDNSATRNMAKMSLPTIKQHLDTADHLEDMLD